MGVIIEGKWTGGLKVKMTHKSSGVCLETDPPRDNGGDASSFSPTDLLATAYLSCMMTIMALRAKKEGWDLDGLSGSVEKTMSSDAPRRISQLDIAIKMPHNLLSTQKEILQKIAEDCPVAKSVSKEIHINIQYT